MDYIKKRITKAPPSVAALASRVMDHRLTEVLNIGEDILSSNPTSQTLKTLYAIGFWGEIVERI